LYRGCIYSVYLFFFHHMADKTYLEANRGYVTASKLKKYIKNPEEYKVQYVDEVVLEDEEESESMKIGTALDYLLTNGRSQFLERYFEDDGYTIAQLAERLAFMACPCKEWYDWNGIDDPDYSQVVDIEERSRLTSVYAKQKKEALVKEYYGDTSGKIRLTAWQARRVIGMYTEVMRQPMFDVGSPYDVQVEITCEFEGLPLKWTLDRLAFFDKDHTRYSVEQIMEMQAQAWGDWSIKVEEMWLYGLIRDWKTAGRINRFEYDMENTFDYVTSMAFYYILVRVQFGIQSHVRLDVIESVAPHMSIPYRLDKQKLYKRAVEVIQPWLKSLIKAYANNERLPVKPLTWESVSIWEMADSKYYKYLPSAVWEDPVEPNQLSQNQY